jgi:hypothetical protein
LLIFHQKKPTGAIKNSFYPRAEKFEKKSPNQSKPVPNKQHIISSPKKQKLIYLFIRPEIQKHKQPAKKKSHQKPQPPGAQKSNTHKNKSPGLSNPK